MSTALQRVSFRKPIVPQPRKAKKQAAATWFPWEEKEDKIVKANFPMGGFAACRPLLPTRTPLAIQQRANKLGLKYIGPCPNGRARIEPPWTAAEQELLKRVPLHDLEKSAEIFREHGFQRSPTAIKVRTVRLELSRRYKDTLSASSASRIIGVDCKSLTREILLATSRRRNARQSVSRSRAVIPGRSRPWICGPTS